MAAGLTAFEKYTDSYRLDHPDFVDVCATTFKKGVITDFQKVQDDPIQVTSQVKVDLGGDFIPLFFCPKKQYWDTAIHQAQDFNQDRKYYENAWMSLRVGDQVKVVLQKGVPVAVLAFGDGVPRIGEDVIKFVGADCISNPSPPPNYAAAPSGPVWVRCSLLGQQYPNGDNGPDNLPLKLVQSAKCILSKKVSTDQYVIGPGWEYSPPIGWLENIVITGWSPVYTFYTADTYNYKVFDTETEQYHLNYYHYLIPVGAILYLFQVIYGSLTAVLSYTYDTVCLNTGGYYIGYSKTQSEAAELALMIAQNQTQQQNDLTLVDNYIANQLNKYLQLPDPGTANNPFQLVGLDMSAAPYSDDLYNNTKGVCPDITIEEIMEGNWKNIIEQYDSFTHQTEFTLHLRLLETNFNCDPPFPSGGKGLTVTVRPHTKAELQAAGMWPEALNG